MFGVSPGKGNWETVALNDAVKSALLRNPTYTPGSTFQQRLCVREFWKQELTKIANEYVKGQKNRSAYEADILRLQETMNNKFCQAFQSRSTRCDPVFRVAHAQKSLSLVLKHFWCNGAIEEPPACPVDRLILTIAEAPFGSRTWTSVNSIQAYRCQLAFLDKAAKAAFQSVAVWELLNFK